MPLYITTISGKTYERKQYANLNFDVFDITTVQVDGEELAFVRKHFKNIPMMTGINGYVIWNGKDAQFIVANLLVPMSLNIEEEDGMVPVVHRPVETIKQYQKRVKNK